MADYCLCERYPFDKARIIDALLTKKKPSIAVIGDFCLDKYLYIDASLDEISVETGKIAWQVRRKRLFPGAGGTIASNLAALGASVFAVGVYGDDGEGDDLIRALQRIGCDTRGMIRGEGLLTSTYMKPMREVDSVWTELNRLDFRNDRPLSSTLIAAAERKMRSILPECDGVIIADQFTYEAGSLLTGSFRQTLAETAAAIPQIFFMVDSRSNAEKYRNCLVKCNASEILDLEYRLDHPDQGAQVAVDSEADQKVDLLLTAGRQVAKRNGQPVLVTRGAWGSLLFEGEKTFEIPPFPATPPFDICGAGDATNAGFAFARALGLNLAESALVAGIVSSITIQQIGVTGTASVEAVIRRLEEWNPNDKS